MIDHDEQVEGERPNGGWRGARRLLGLMLPERAKVIGALLLTVVAVGLTIVGPLLIGRAVDTIFAGAVGRGLDPDASLPEVVAELRQGGQDRFADMVERMEVVPGAGISFEVLGGVVLLIIGLYAVAAVAEFGHGWLVSDASHAAAQRLREDVEHKVHRLPTAHLDGSSRGDVLSRVTNDVDNVTRTLSQTLSQLIVGALTVIGVLAMMLAISPLLTLVALAVLPIVTLLTRVVMKRSQPRFIEQWTHTGELNSQIEEALTAHELVTQYGRQDDVLGQFDATNAKLTRSGQRAQFLSGLINPLMVVLTNLLFVVICVVGALRVISGQMTLGGVTAFVQYSQQLSAPLSQIASMANLVQSGIASAERVFDLLDLPEEPERTTATASLTGTPQGRIEFDAVSFDYGAEPVLDSVDLRVDPGSTVAVVGRSGSGKTTLINLLMRFYDPCSGRILLDGVDTATLARGDVRRHCGLVLQDTWLFSGTIRDNIAYGNPAASDDDIQRAAEAANLDPFVRLLPAGYDTVIDEEADNLSAGERQLIAIARAFVSDPAILLLDEATSAVDTRTEASVQQALETLRSQRTAVIVAHRLSTIRDADTIVVMEAGRIVEQGCHEELMARGGAYRELYEADLAAPEQVVDSAQPALA